MPLHGTHTGQNCSLYCCCFAKSCCFHEAFPHLQSPYFLLRHSKNNSFFQRSNNTTLSDVERQSLTAVPKSRAGSDVNHRIYLIHNPCFYKLQGCPQICFSFTSSYSVIPVRFITYTTPPEAHNTDETALSGVLSAWISSWLNCCSNLFSIHSPVLSSALHDTPARTEITAGDTPDIRDACPMDAGRICDNFCFASNLQDSVPLHNLMICRNPLFLQFFKTALPAFSAVDITFILNVNIHLLCNVVFKHWTHFNPLRHRIS